MDFKIKKGFDIALAGKPVPDVMDTAPAATVAVYPLEFDRMKQRLKVAVGDPVKRGSELMEDKACPEFKLRAPAAGRISSIVRGARRFVEKIVMDVDESQGVESFRSFSAEEIGSLDRETILNQLVTTGYLSFIRQRPFSGMADANARPKSIFVNAMNTAPFRADVETVVWSDQDAFKAGLNILTRLTDGPVHLCLGENAGDTLRSAQDVQVHNFSGPHPSGNTSVHISRIDPMDPHDIVWTIKAVDLVNIGRLFLDGALPTTRIISLGGPGVQAESQRHYRVAVGADLGPLLSASMEEGPYRSINGDVLSGKSMESGAYLRFHQSAITVIPEDRERQFLGWTMPGLKQMSTFRLFLSTWLHRSAQWSLGTNLHGEERALVLTGHYDRYMPLNIMVDYLIRAVLAGDTDEAIALGILETDPEDFALCEFVCPSKVEVQNVIRQGLKAIEEEGI